MTTDDSFVRWFRTVTSHASPRAWQVDLAKESACRDRLIRIPTGLGKTEGVLAAWSFHRLSQSDDRWPRRLVWCLPMRCDQLVGQFGPGARAFRESLLHAADVRASRLKTNDLVPVRAESEAP